MSIPDLQELLNTRLYNAVKTKPNVVNSELVQRGLQMTLDEIERFSLKSTDPDGKKFISALVLVKLEEEAPKGLAKINLFNHGIELIRLEQELKDIVAETCDSILVSELSETTDMNETMKWCIEGAKFKRASGVYLNGHDLGFINITNFLWEKSSDLSTECNASELFKTLEYLILAQRDADVDDLEALILAIGGTAISFIEENNNIDGLGNENPQNNIQEAHQILDYLEQLKIEDDDFKGEVVELRQKCTQIEQPRRIFSNIIPILEPFVEMNVNLSNIAIKYIKNPNLDEKEQNVIYANRWANFQVSIHKAEFENKNVTIKKYVDVKNPNDIERINKEIKIYQVLSEMSNHSNCFLKYYGTYVDKMTINMVMEYQDKTLALKIDQMRDEKAKKNFNHNETMIGVMFFKLISSFAQMKDLGIIHGDIKPDNFLCDEHTNLKIIDFNISMVKNTDFINSTQLISKSVGNPGFRAPELEDAYKQGLKDINLNPEKADVFSLGLVLLNFLTLENVYELNSTEKNVNLMRKVQDLPIYWTKELLRNMLQADPTRRSTFNQSLAFIPPSATPSMPR